MPWLLVDLLLLLLAVVALVVVGLRLWRGVKALGREVTVAGRLVGAASEALTVQQQGVPGSTGPGAPGRAQRLP